LKAVGTNFAASARQMRKQVTILAVSFVLVLLSAANVHAQIYFDLQPQEVKAKAEKHGFVFSRKEGSEGDSTKLFFYKKADAKNILTCYFNREGNCYQFSYSLPASSVVAFHKNLNTNFVKRESSLWESREKKFLLHVDDRGGTTTVLYLPYTEE